ncbi:DUF4328 domain-containing protein [Kribbella sp. NPDC006257]|uniref:DUF4328 domain-containing protein n=1 Tax=Kribbella sp. NPDC006257 TaxID=3156738 RepID=UPI0033AF64AB
MSVPYDGVAPAQATGYLNADRIGRGASILVCAVAGCQVLVTLEGWRQYADSKDDPQSVNLGSLRPLDGVSFVLTLAAATLFIRWLRRARMNAESLCRARQRHDRGWVIVGWFAPVFWFWIPKQIVDDIVIASSPATPRDAELLPMEQTPVVLIWWTAWLAGSLVNIPYPFLRPDPMTAAGLAGSAVFTTLSTVFTVVAAVYAVRVIRYVNELQASRSVAR